MQYDSYLDSVDYAETNDWLNSLENKSYFNEGVELYKQNKIEDALYNFEAAIVNYEPNSVSGFFQILHTEYKNYTDKQNQVPLNESSSNSSSSESVTEIVSSSSSSSSSTTISTSSGSSSSSSIESESGTNSDSSEERENKRQKYNDIGDVTTYGDIKQQWDLIYKEKELINEKLELIQKENQLLEEKRNELTKDNETIDNRVELLIKTFDEHNEEYNSKINAEFSKRCFMCNLFHKPKKNLTDIKDKLITE